jgi:hypothetical protein
MGEVDDVYRICGSERWTEMTWCEFDFRGSFRFVFFVRRTWNTHCIAAIYRTGAGGWTGALWESISDTTAPWDEFFAFASALFHWILRSLPRLCIWSGSGIIWKEYTSTRERVGDAMKDTIRLCHDENLCGDQWGRSWTRGIEWLPL